MELRDQLPVLAGSITYGDGKRWGGQVPIGTEELDLSPGARHNGEKRGQAPGNVSVRHGALRYAGSFPRLGRESVARWKECAMAL